MSSGESASPLIKARRARTLVFLALLFALVGIVGALGRARLPFFSLEPKSPTRLGDAPRVEEALFSVVAESSDRAELALDFLADSVEKESRFLKLSPWGLDDESLATKRLYLLSDEEFVQLSDDLEIARELAANRWDFLSADAFLRRFDELAKSEFPEDRARALESATPFVAALADSLEPIENALKLGSSRRVPVRSPLASGALESATKTRESRYFFSRDKKGGVVVAGLIGARRDSSLAALSRILDKARAEFPDLAIRLDSPSCAEFVGRELAFRAAVAAILPALIAGLAFGWLVFGSLPAAFFATFGAAAISAPALCLARCFSLPSDALLAAFAALVGFSLAQIPLAATRPSDAPPSREPIGLAAIFVALGVALALFPNRETREFGLALALGIPVETLGALALAPAIRATFEKGKSRSLRVEELSLSISPVLRGTLAVALFIACAYCVYRSREPELPTDSLPSELSDAFRGDVGTELCDRGALFVASFPKSEEDRETIVARLLEDETLRLDEWRSLFPKATLERRRAVEAVADRLARVPLELGEPTIPDRETLLAALTELAESARASEVDSGIRDAALEELERAIQGVESSGDEDLSTRLDAFEAWVVVETVKRLFAEREIADPAPPALDDFSERIRARYFAESGAPAILIGSTADLRRAESLDALVENARAIDPDVSGPAVVALARAKRGRLGAFLALGISFALLALFVGIRERSIWRASLALFSVALVACSIFGVGIALGVPVSNGSILLAAGLAPTVGALLARERSVDSVDSSSAPGKFRAPSEFDAAFFVGSVALAVACFAPLSDAPTRRSFALSLASLALPALAAIFCRPSSERDP